MNTVTPSSQVCLSLNEKLPLNEAGGKASHLSTLVSWGYKVPPAVVIPASLTRANPKMNDAIMHTLRGALVSTGTGPWAVRSSGIAEDGNEHSFAGQFATLLNVKDEHLQAAIETCIASAHSASIMQYHHTAGLGIAVIIQQMLQPTVSGVAFSANPVTGERNQVVINAVNGTGDKLVSGEITPLQVIYKNGNTTRSGNEAISLQPEQIKLIAETAAELEKKYGAPQDIEWAFVNHDFYLLQSRPITALPPEPIAIPIEPVKGTWERDDHHYTISPLVFDTWMKPYGPALTHAIGRVGIPLKAMHFKIIGGHLYSKMDMGSDSTAVPPRFVLWLVSRLIPAFRKANKTGLRMKREKFYNQDLETWEKEWRPWFEKEMTPMMDADFSKMSRAELLEQFAKLEVLLKRSAEVHGVLGVNHSIGVAEFGLFCEKHWNVSYAESMRWLGGYSETSSSAAREWMEICENHFSPVQLKEKSELIRDQFAVFLESNPEFHEKIKKWIHDNRYRMQSYDLTEPSFGAKPQTVYQSVQVILLQMAEGNAPQITRPDDSKIKEYRSKLSSEALKKEFDELFSWARRWYANRDENGVLIVSKLVGLVQKLAFAIAARIGLKNEKDINLLYALEIRDALNGNAGGLAEKIKIRAGELQWAKLNRGPKYYGPKPPPMPPVDAFPEGLQHVFSIFGYMIKTEIEPAPNAGFDEKGSQLHGIGIFAGSVTGTARLIRGPQDFHKIRKGDLLVCRITTPEWSILFNRIGGLVTEEGGMLSHPAIIAREFSIPTVVGTQEAMQRIRDGQRITIDGVSGSVKLHG